MLEKPKIKKIDKQDGNMPANIEQLIQKYDLEKLWPYIEEIVEATAASKLATLQAENPIGTIRFQTTNVNPATFLGFGTWVLWGAGRVPVGVDTADSNFNTVEKTGGANSNSTSYTPAGTVGSHTLTVDEIPAHRHEQRIDYSNTTYAHANPSGGTASTGNVAGHSSGTTLVKNKELVFTNNTGGGKGHNHGFTGTEATINISSIQKYITCYMWKRTA